ncbi:MAG: MBG domain-containing protein, partial [Lachnospiraceae bacterium]
NYTGSKTADFTITKAAETEKADISRATMTLSQTSYTYDGKAKTPSVTVKLDGKTLVLNTDYTVSYSNNINVGTAKVTITGKGNYTGSKTADFTITKAADTEKADISKATMTLSQTSYTYDGKAKTPSVTVKLDNKTLVLNTDYTISYSNNTNVGTAKVTITGKGNYTGSKTADFTITKAAETEKADISRVTMTLSQTSYTYDGKAKTPSVTVKLDGKTLVFNADYTISYSNNTKVGTAKVTITGKGNYMGSKTASFTIKKADISKATMTLSQTSYTYNGKAKTPSVTVKLDGKTLALNTDYTISYSNNTKVGTAKVTITGKGNYTGKKTVSFTIKKAATVSITCKKTLYKVAYGTKPFKINASSKSKMTFTSSKPKIAAVNKDTGKVTIKNTGIATITIKAGKVSKKVTIEVSPKKPSVKSAQAVKGKKLTVKWAKDKMASGYQVQVSTDKKFKKDMKSKKISKTSYTFTKLKTGKKYYVRLRSYKESDKGLLYGTWSKVKLSSKIKK